MSTEEKVALVSTIFEEYGLNKALEVAGELTPEAVPL
jgi:hypothetical protein